MDSDLPSSPNTGNVRLGASGDSETGPTLKEILNKLESIERRIERIEKILPQPWSVKESPAKALMDGFVKTQVLKSPIYNDEIKEEIQEKSIQFGDRLGDRNTHHAMELAKYGRKKFCALKAKLRFTLLEHAGNEFLPLKSLVKKLTAGIALCRNDREEARKLVLCMRYVAAKHKMFGCNRTYTVTMIDFWEKVSLKKDRVERGQTWEVMEAADDHRLNNRDQ